MMVGGLRRQNHEEGREVVRKEEGRQGICGLGGSGRCSGGMTVSVKAKNNSTSKGGG